MNLAEEMLKLVERPDRDIRYELSELAFKVLQHQTRFQSDTETVTVKFKVSREDWNRFRLENPAHMDLDRRQMIVEIIQDQIYDNGSLEYTDFNLSDGG